MHVPKGLKKLPSFYRDYNTGRKIATSARMAVKRMNVTFKLQKLERYKDMNKEGCCVYHPERKPLATM
jgi:hypothetical protein